MATQAFPRVTELAELVEMYRALCKLAGRSDEWSEVLAQESMLRQKLESVLEKPVEPQESDAIRILLQELMVVNHALTAHVEQQREKLALSVQHNNRVQRAATAYSHTVAG